MEMVMSWPDSRRKKAAAAAEANAIIGAGKAARPCDGCLGKRARWYCPADDAFLCPACDSSVHAANQLAGRHDRLRLLPTPPPPHTSTQPPSWHAGFSRKSRTPRKHNKSNHHHVVADVVPDILTSNDDNINGDDDTDSPRVPVLDPLAFGPAAAVMEEEEEDYFSNMMMMMKENPVNMGMELDTSINFDDDFENLGAADDDQLILSPGMDLAELVANVEYLLDDDDDENVVEQALQGRIKEEEAAIDEEEDEDGYVKCEKKEEEEGIVCNSSSGNSGKIFLRLNYEDVIRAWGKQLGGSPNWTTTPNTPPSAGGLLLHHHPNWPLHHHHHHNMINCPPGGGRGRGGAERVERVLRYKEKRRRRLFAKKIRYQVRKLNAENRPRFKGRFVKRI